MKFVGTSWAVWAVVVAASGPWTLPVEAATRAKKADTTAKLVDETLQREAREGIDDRAEVLKPELAKPHPSNAAYWHSGFVYDRARRRWLSPEEIQQRAAEDRRLTAYRTIRARRAANTADGQAELARWCERRNLTDQARAHWTEVLNLTPDDEEARRQLGFVLVNGTWLSQAEMADARARFARLDASLARWAPKLEKLLTRLEKSNPKARELARQELAAIKDPDVAPAIEAMLCSQGGELALLGIELLEKMKAAEAAQALAWEAVFSPWPPIRTAAAEALRSQRKHDYVPALLTAMRAPVQASYGLYDSPDGGFLVRRVFYQEGPEGRELAVSDVARPSMLLRPERVAEFEAARAYPDRQKEIDRLIAGDLQRQLVNLTIARANTVEQIRQQQAAIAAQNLSIVNLNSRLCSVLAEATGEAQPASPNDWYGWWNNYNEISMQGDMPTKVTYQASNQPIVTVAQVPPLPRYSCLVAGTPVWTELGAMPVEQIRVGDRVLACDCESGQIAMKPVLKTIVNPGTPLLRLHTAGETLEVTGGHVFWVSGQGWVKARELESAMRLHTLRGTVDLKSVESSGKQDTYNLIVADFHTYFAGRQRILTHDNTIRKPTNCVVPGLAGHAAAMSP